jgi:hypothetical protein
MKARYFFVKCIKNEVFLQNERGKFGNIKKKYYLCTEFEKIKL